MDWVVVLAAGRGVRAGGPKALHRVHVGGSAGGVDRTLLWWKVQAARLAGVGLAVMWVVSERVLAGMRAEGSEPARWVLADEMGAMFESVVAGMRGVRVVCEREEAALPRCVFVLPVDVPAAGSLAFEALRTGLAGGHEAGAAVPVWAGERGHPVCVRWRFVEESVLAAGAGARLDRLIEGRVVEVGVEDGNVAVNLNTGEEFEMWATTNRERDRRQ